MAENRFPGGVAAPGTIVFVLLLALAAVCVGGLDVPGAWTIPGAVIQERAHQTQDVGALVARDLTDVRTTMESQTAHLIDDRGITPRAVLDAMDDPGWLGVAVLDQPGGRVLAARGEPVVGVPVDLGAGVTVRAQDTPSAPRWTASRRLNSTTQGWVVVGTRRLTVPSRHSFDPGGLGVYLAGADGRMVGADGPVLTGVGSAIRGAVEQAAVAGGAGETGTSALDPVTGLDGSATVVSYSPVDEASRVTAPGLAVVTVSTSPASTLGEHRGLVAGIGLGLIVVLGAAALVLLLLVPIRRLRLAALDTAAGGTERPIAVTRIRELNVIADALRSSRSRLHGGDATSRPVRCVPALGVVLAVAVVLAGWSTAMWFATDCDGRDVPASAVADARNQNRAAAQGLSSSLTRSVADVEAVASRDARVEPDQMLPALTTFVSSQPRYHSMYVLGPDGRTVVAAGREPLRSDEPVPSGSGIVQGNTSGSMPVVFAYAALARPGYTVVAELDIAYLSGQLALPPGWGTVVDGGMRTVLASGGFQAFAPVTDPVLRAAVESAQRDRPYSGIEDIGGEPSLVSVDPVAAGDLHWSVMTDQPIAALDMAASPSDRRTELSALVALFLTGALAGLYHLILVRPLRRLADHAERLRLADLEEVIYPQRHDEIGTIACCLEILRLALLDGRHRLGPRRHAGLACPRPPSAATPHESATPQTARPGEPESVDVAPEASAAERASSTSALITLSTRGD